MTPFRAKIGCKMMRKAENKNYRFVPFLPDALQKIPKKIAKKFKKLKNASMASFKARISWKMPRQKENKYCRSVSFLPNA